jgi:O-antigen ligase
MPRTPRVTTFGPSVTLGLLSGLLALAGAIAIAQSGSLNAPALLAVLMLSGVVILLSFRAEALLISWLALAPFLQGFGSHPGLHPLSLALYLVPPLVFLLWTLTSPTRAATLGVARSLGFADALPAAYFLFILGSISLTGQVSVASLRSAYQTIGIGIILYYFVAFGPVKSLAPRRVAKLLLVLAALEAVMSIIDGVVGWNLWHDTSWQHERAVATLNDPAALGTFIGMGFALAVGVLVWRGPRELRPLAVAMVAVGLPGLFFTYTRGPIVGTVVAVSLILLSRAGSRLLAVCGLALIIVTLSLTWGRLTSSDVYHRRIAQAHTVDIRVELERQSLKLAEERPLFGWGFGSFDRVLRSSNFNSGDISHEEVIANTSHNTFLTILVEYGSIGLSLFVVPWLVIGGRALAAARRFADMRWLLLGCVAALVVYAFAAGAIDFRFFSFVPAVPWLLLGLLRRHQSLVHEV